MVTHLTFATLVLTSSVAWPSRAASDWSKRPSPARSDRIVTGWAELRVPQWGSQASSIESPTPFKGYDAVSPVHHAAPRMTRAAESLKSLTDSPQNVDDEGSVVRMVTRWWWVALALWGVQTWVTGRMSLHPWS